LSPGRGLLWYSAAVILALVAWQRARPSQHAAVLLIAVVFFGYLLLYSAWAEWAGGDSWGPRFLLPGLPGLFALIGLLEARWRRYLVALTIIGFIVSAPTLVSFYARYYLEASQAGVPADTLLWSPTSAPAVQVWGSASRQVIDSLSSDVRELIQSTNRQRDRASEEPAASRPTLRGVTLWWWMLPAVGIPRWVGATLAAMLIGMAIYLCAHALRAARSMDTDIPDMGTRVPALFPFLRSV